MKTLLSRQILKKLHLCNQRFISVFEKRFSGKRCFQWFDWSSISRYLLEENIWQKPINTFQTFKISRLEVFCKKGVLRNLAKFTRKHLCQSLFFNKGPDTLLKKRLWCMCFPVNFCQISKNTFSYRAPPVAASEKFGFYYII